MVFLLLWECWLVWHRAWEERKGARRMLDGMD
jgi:hypothetical protein